MKPPIYSPYRPKRFRSMAFRPSRLGALIGSLAAALAVMGLWVVVGQ